MKAMDPGAPMISVPAGVIKDFISNTPSPKSPLVSKNSSGTPAASPPRTPTPDGETASATTEKPNHVQNGESVSDKILENSIEKLNLPSSITISTEKIPARGEPPANINGTKRQCEDLDPKPDLKKIRVFAEDKSKSVESSVKEFNKILDKESKKLETENDIMCLSNSITVVKSDDRTLIEKANCENVRPLPENVQSNSNSQAKDGNSLCKPEQKNEIKSTAGNLPMFSSDLEVLHENVKDEKSKLNERVKKLPRKELERIILHLFTEKVLYQCELGRQKQWCEKLETTLEGNRKKTVQFHKEIEDLRKVTNKLTQEQAARKGQYVAPIRIKRSVGIQAAPHIINKGLQHAQTNNSAVKTISPRSSFSPLKQGIGSQGRLQAPAPNVTFNTKMSPGNPTMLAGGATGMPAQQPTSRPQALGGNPALLNTAVSVGAVPHSAGGIGTIRPAGGGQMLMMTQSAPGVMQAIPRPTTAGEALPVMVGGTVNPVTQSNLSGHRQILTNKGVSSSNAVSAPDFSRNSGGHKYAHMEGRAAVGRTSTVMPSPGTLVKVPVTGAAQLVAIPQTGVVLLPNASAGATLVSGVQTVNSPIVAQSRTGTVTSTPRIMANSFRPISATAINSSSVNQQPKHPAPLPRTQAQQVAGTTKKLPPQPSLRLSHKDNSIVLSWTMAKTDDHEPISSYQLYAYQEGSQPPSWTLWKKVGSVKALELPMACTLTQFMPGHVYHFAVRAVDIKSRLGPFSEPQSIRLEKK